MASANQPQTPSTPFQYQFNIIGPTQLSEREHTQATSTAKPPSQVSGEQSLLSQRTSGKPSPAEGVQLTPGIITPDSQAEAQSDDILFETMVTATGRLVLEGRDKWRYTGSSSYGAFIERMRTELGDWASGLDKSVMSRNF
ncbi:MAG: hypothetical protein FRX48_06020 [Lasallia pustulata]|uniref:Uncharacterized protein n=1 Tax=Lasallia pustulata TaxID=136370 RepID=A0A5M8PNM1_9LECA|nr:MAG: hypothetical protein FRX48_06020 [Lasallia pustulata]